MSELTGGNQPGRLDIQEANGLLQEKVKAQDAEIRELKAALEALMAHCSNNIERASHDILFWEESATGDYDYQPVTSPELIRYLCKQKGWPNPLERAVVTDA